VPGSLTLSSAINKKTLFQNLLKNSFVFQEIETFFLYVFKFSTSEQQLKYHIFNPRKIISEKVLFSQKIDF
jgi:hypothetical protein